MPEGVSFLKTIQKPNKITVSTNNGTTPSRRLDLIIAMLEHEHALLLGQKVDGDRLLDLGVRRPSNASRPAPRREVAGIISRGSKATQSWAGCSTKWSFFGRSPNRTTPSRPRAARECWLGPAIGVLRSRFVLDCLFHSLVRPGVGDRAHASVPIVGPLVHCGRSMIMTPMKIWASPWVGI